MRRWSLLAVSGLALTPAAAIASQAGVFQVAQPIFTDAGVTIVQVPFLTHRLHGLDPAAELLLTVEPNCVTDDNGPEQRNVAAKLIRFVNSSPGTAYQGRDRPRLRGDTLDVRVDLSGLPPLPSDARVRGGHLRLQQDLVGATLWCGLLNARAHWPVVRFVRYEIEGGTEFAHLAGVYALEPLQPPWRPVEPWSDSRLEGLRR